ncbi:MAG: hypothetical protein KGJ99_01000 [Betaproteobacteria bacterium]|nr:hypothetical protein [Betaproteobacteria bacterium]MDE2208280.1 hypothetical protein [Betaproteobacteria bacterium]
MIYNLPLRLVMIFESSGVKLKCQQRLRNGHFATCAHVFVSHTAFAFIESCAPIRRPEPGRRAAIISPGSVIDHSAASNPRARLDHPASSNPRAIPESVPRADSHGGVDSAP